MGEEHASIAKICGLCQEVCKQRSRSAAKQKYRQVGSDGSKGVGSLCATNAPSSYGWKRCFTNDEGRSLEVGVQAQTSNHRKRRGLRVFVGNVAGKGGARLRQVRIKKTNVSEPLMTCRKTSSGVETGIETLSREAGGGLPVYGSAGVRHEGGVILIQAWVRKIRERLGSGLAIIYFSFSLNPSASDSP